MEPLSAIQRILPLLLVVALLQAGCASKLPYSVSEPQLGAPSVARMSGSFRVTDGSEVDLASVSDRPVILVFGQDTCLTCSEEANSLKQSLASSDRPPTKVALYTVLVGALLEDALEWKASHGVPWPVGFDPDSALFKQYCTGPTVPCNIVYVPSSGIVLRRTGKVSSSELIALTGPWEDS